MKAAALRGALSDRTSHGRVSVVSRFVEGEAPSTSAALTVLRAAVGETGARLPWSVLVVASDGDELTRKSLRNAVGVRVLATGQLNTYDVLASDHVVFTQAALSEFTGQEPSAEDAPAKDAPAKEKPAAKDTPAEDAPAQDAPARNAKAKAADAEDAPAKAKPAAKAAPTGDAPAKDVEATDAPAKDADAEDAPAEAADSGDAPPKAGSAKAKRVKQTEEQPEQEEQP
jgi:large subunit ribosomal protein L4